MADLSLDIRANIVGGHNAILGEFPHQVQLSYDGAFLCGGSIISTLFILTAAHCLDGRRTSRLWTVRAGIVDRSKNGSQSEQVRTGRYLFVHKEYNNTFANDIAIIILREPLVYTKYVRNIVLPAKSEEFNGNVVISGWGRTGSAARLSPNILQKATIPIVPRDTCKRMYGSYGNYILNSTLCAGDLKKEGRATCQGDSGGPVTCDGGSRNQRVLCGITSFGVGCGSQGVPSGYVNVGSYIDYIRTAVGWMRKFRMQEKCSTDKFYCWSTHRCISRSWICDGYHDCSTTEAEDETKCQSKQNCNATQHRCDNGKCVSQGDRCNYHKDCGDTLWSDESKCPSSEKTCPQGHHKCGNTGRCIPNSWKCDGVQDCDDNSDELNCTKTNECSLGRPSGNIKWVLQKDVNTSGLISAGKEKGKICHIIRSEHYRSYVIGRECASKRTVSYMGSLINVVTDVEYLIVPPDSTSWVASSGHKLPENSICGGVDPISQYKMYICRAMHSHANRKSVLVGSYVAEEGYCFIGFERYEYRYDTFEVLVTNYFADMDDDDSDGAPRPTITPPSEEEPEEESLKYLDSW